ncbi:ABC transporter substrate-binding protein [Pseudactinotalea suaedae]|uniref:ABC transporter substrate-binding protein n=1 Tax=Pseudactinotalea suaedae TaxID=1524924 RepID=UPI001391AF83|nr:ABC transporter substrate-binding protein [Pseudactinotalea suaedae]
MTRNDGPVPNSLSPVSRLLPRRRFLAVAGALGAGVPLAAALTGCSDSNGGFQPSASPTAPAGTLSGEVVVAIQQNPDDAAKKALTDAYAQVQPDVTIVWETKEQPRAEYLTYLGTQLAANEIRLDLVSGNYVPTFANFVNFDAHRGEENPYTGNPWDTDLDFDFARSVNAQGELIMLASQSVHVGWYYNKTIFAEVGVEPPTTWEEFIAVCAAIKEHDVTPISINFEFQLPQWVIEVYFDQYHADWVETVRAQDGDWNFNPEVDADFSFDPENPNLHSTYTYNLQRFYQALRDGTLRYDTDRMVEMITNLTKVFPQYATDDMFVLDDAYAPFLQQRTAIMSSGSWSMVEIANDLSSITPERLAELGLEPGSIESFEWGTFENPAMQSGLVQTSIPRAVESAAGEYISVVDKQNGQTEAAIDFARFWLSSAGYQPYLDATVAEGSWVPRGPLEVANLEEPEANSVFETLESRGNAEINYNGFWMFGGPASQAADKKQLFHDVLQGKTTPQEYAAQLQHYITDHIDETIADAGLSTADIENPARRPSGL